MVTITVILPPDTPSKVVDVIDVSVLDNTRDRQARGTLLEGMTRDEDKLTLTFTTY